MELSSVVSQVSSQASAQLSAQMSLLLLQKTLELQSANISGLVQDAAPVSAAANPPNLGNSIDVMA